MAGKELYLISKDLLQRAVCLRRLQSELFVGEIEPISWEVLEGVLCQSKQSKYRSLLSLPYSIFICRGEKVKSIMKLGT